jgi:hypothetical protein
MGGDIPMDILLKTSQFVTCKSGHGLLLACKDIQRYNLPRITREKQFQTLLRSIHKIQEKRICFGKIQFSDTGDCIHCTMRPGVDSLFCTMCVQYINHNNTLLC